MAEVEATKADSVAAPKKAAIVPKKAAKKKGDGVAVKNISDRLINTSKGSILAGESGYASEQECRSLGKFLERKE